MVEAVARYFKVAPNNILQAERGAGKKNIPRQVALYLCQALTGTTLVEMAAHFNVAHYSTVSKTIQRLKKEWQTDRAIANAINGLSQDLTP